MSALYLNFSSYGINDKTVPVIMADIGGRVNGGVKEINILLASPGGSVNDGIALYNFLKGLPVDITTYNIGNIDSIANVVFLAGKKRFAVPTAYFFFHDVGFDGLAGSRHEIRTLQPSLDSLRRDRERIATICCSESRITREVLDGLFDHSGSLNPQEAKEYGIINDSMELCIPEGSQILTYTFA